MISITDPEGPEACRQLMDGMLVVAHLKDFAPDIIISANMSIISTMARKMPGSRAVIADGLRRLLSSVETGEVLNDETMLSRRSADQSLH